ncbi:hypothetical protein H072_4243 [Dactylellina haptotyla CBS 200.50]|uniref:Uncharacterized protein n=1 Tax=Dactylellina haptotyla (strain CBS 200.50) TaxID=1284197 RepID=S8BR08_DACHA|nr:hypothetical protein H072_4243 [Dactylellina haptotyla CBS 200.50]
MAMVGGAPGGGEDPWDRDRNRKLQPGHYKSKIDTDEKIQTGPDRKKKSKPGQAGEKKETKPGYDSIKRKASYLLNIKEQDDLSDAANNSLELHLGSDYRKNPKGKHRFYKSPVKDAKNYEDYYWAKSRDLDEKEQAAWDGTIGKGKKITEGKISRFGREFMSGMTKMMNDGVVYPVLNPRDDNTPRASSSRSAAPAPPAQQQPQQYDYGLDQATYELLQYAEAMGPVPYEPQYGLRGYQPPPAHRPGPSMTSHQSRGRHVIVPMDANLDGELFDPEDEDEEEQEEVEYAPEFRKKPFDKDWFSRYK